MGGPGVLATAVSHGCAGVKKRRTEPRRPTPRGPLPGWPGPRVPQGLLEPQRWTSARCQRTPDIPSGYPCQPRKANSPEPPPPAQRTRTRMGGVRRRFGRHRLEFTHLLRRPNSWPGRRFGDAPCRISRRSAIRSAKGLETARALGGRSDLNVGKSTLWEAVAMLSWRHPGPSSRGADWPGPRPIAWLASQSTEPSGALRLEGSGSLEVGPAARRPGLGPAGHGRLPGGEAGGGRCANSLGRIGHPGRADPLGVLAARAARACARAAWARFTGSGHRSSAVPFAVQTHRLHPTKPLPASALPCENLNPSRPTHPAKGPRPCRPPSPMPTGSGIKKQIKYKQLADNWRFPPGSLAPQQRP